MNNTCELFNLGFHSLKLFHDTFGIHAASEIATSDASIWYAEEQGTECTVNNSTLLIGTF